MTARRSLLSSEAPGTSSRRMFPKKRILTARSSVSKARGRLPVEILGLNAAERNASDLALAVDRGWSRSARAERDSEVVGESIGGAERENGECDGRAR